MPKTFDARIAQYEEMITNIQRLRNLETGSTFHDIDLEKSEELFHEHLEALKLGKQIAISTGHLDVEKELESARLRVHQLETLRQLQNKEH